MPLTPLPPSDDPLVQANRERSRAWRAAHREESRARARADYAAHREKRLAKAKARYQANRDEINEGNKARYRRLRDEDRDGQRVARLRKYGLNRTVYDAMLEAQGGLCAICRRPETSVYGGRTKRLAVDHDHATGKIRGLLCGECNRMLAAARDEAPVLAAAIAYLGSNIGYDVLGLTHLFAAT